MAVIALRAKGPADFRDSAGILPDQRAHARLQIVSPLIEDRPADVERKMARARGSTLGNPPPRGCSTNLCLGSKVIPD